jgi:hypothetical protein
VLIARREGQQDSRSHKASRANNDQRDLGTHPFQKSRHKVGKVATETRAFLLETTLVRLSMNGKADAFLLKTALSSLLQQKGRSPFRPF